MAATILTSSPVLGTYWNWREQSIYYVRAGERQARRPPLLLVHGFGASTDHWQKNIAGLSQDFEVWAIDLLGFGRSAKPRLEYRSELWRDQLHEFITDVIGQPVVLAGNSLGGYAALSTAAQRPTSAAGLVLINSAGPFSEIETPPAAQTYPIQRIFGEGMRSLLRQPWASYFLFQYLRQRSMIRKTLQKVYFDQQAVTDQLVEEIYRPSCDPGAAQVFASIFTAPPGEKVDILLGQLTCPLLMLWGEADPWMKVQKRAPQFRKSYPQLSEHFLHAGHCPHDEVPTQVNELISNWVLSISA